MKITKEVIETKDAPRAVGPYSQAIKLGNLIFVSGQIPLDAKTETIKGENIKQQTDAVMNNIKAILEAAGSSLGKIVKTTCYLKNMTDFADFNDAYKTFFISSFPARSTVGGISLPKDVLVEIEVIAEA